MTGKKCIGSKKLEAVARPYVLKEKIFLRCGIAIEKIMEIIE